MRVEMGPRANPADLRFQYYDMYLRVPNYMYLDSIQFLEQCFNQAIMRLNEAGWASIRAPVLHKPATEPHSTQLREWIRAEFPDPNLARVFYYTMRGRVVLSHRSPFTMEVWTQTIGAEVLNNEQGADAKCDHCEPYPRVHTQKGPGHFACGAQG